MICRRPGPIRSRSSPRGNPNHADAVRTSLFADRGWIAAGVHLINLKRSWGGADGGPGEAISRFTSATTVLSRCRDLPPPCRSTFPAPPFDLYRLDKITLPEIRAGDCDELPDAEKSITVDRRGDYERVVQAGTYRELVRADLASMTFADALVGQLIDTLETSPVAKNTIVLLWSDHGWHLGEKQHSHKFTLWERSTRVAFIVAAPSVTLANARTPRPVGLINLFPTRIDLCHLPDVTALKGTRLVHEGSGFSRSRRVAERPCGWRTKAERRWVLYDAASASPYETSERPLHTSGPQRCTRPSTTAALRIVHAERACKLTGEFLDKRKPTPLQSPAYP